MWESRVAPLSGVAFAVLWVASSLVINNFEFMPPADELADFYAGSPVRIMAGSYIGLLSGFALLWFSGSLYASLNQTEAGGRLPLIALGGGLFASGMITLGYLATFATAERAWIHGAVDPGGAAALSDMSAMAIGTGAGFGFAALIGASAIIGLRAVRQYRKTAWASLVLALGLVSPYGWAVIALTLIWVPVVGVWIYRDRERQVEEKGLLV